jgi:hypothetical protein
MNCGWRLIPAHARNKKSDKIDNGFNEDPLDLQGKIQAELIKA